jgi:hypothetical protein
MDQQTYEKIRARAFELFQERDREGAPGGPESDWLQAEREILSKESSERAREQQPTRPGTGGAARRSPVRQTRSPNAP